MHLTVKTLARTICWRMFVFFERNHSTKVHRSSRYPGEVERILVADSQQSGVLKDKGQGGKEAIKRVGRNGRCEEEGAQDKRRTEKKRVERKYRGFKSPYLTHSRAIF